MPGVECGDLGPKIGYNSKDNGWMTLNQVRIPRRNMFMRFVTVDREGNFEIIGDIRILYSVMLFIRVLLIRSAGLSTAAGLTIALRYAAVRRQFSTLQNSRKERRLIDYQAHQFKLIPILALSYTERFASIEVEDLYHQLMQDIKSENFENLELLHHYASGFKAFFCDMSHSALEVIRQSCGGAGFS
jgi:acyl-CoA oxidase